MGRQGSISLLLSGSNGFQSIQTIADARSVVGTQTIVVSAMELVPSSLTAGDLRFALTGVGDERVFFWSCSRPRERDSVVDVDARAAVLARGIEAELASEVSSTSVSNAADSADEGATRYSRPVSDADGDARPQL